MFKLGVILRDRQENAYIDISLENNSGWNLIGMAIRVGCLPTCQILIQKVVDINKAFATERRLTAIQEAASQGFEEIVEHILALTADTNALLYKSIIKYALLGAIEGNKCEIALSMVEKGKAIESINQIISGVDRFSPSESCLHLAAEASNEMLKMLINAVADVNMRILVGKDF